jgi:hypothetical protein
MAPVPDQVKYLGKYGAPSVDASGGVPRAGDLTSALIRLCRHHSGWWPGGPIGCTGLEGPRWARS